MRGTGQRRKVRGQSWFFAGAVWLALGAALHAAETPGPGGTYNCWDRCTSEVSCSTGCYDEAGNWTTCGLDGSPCDGGPSGGPYCGDGACQVGLETCANCTADCGTCPLIPGPRLVFQLPTELKKTNCAGDDDGDCLDNYAESLLAGLAAPHYYYDEDESCAGPAYTDNPSTLHYGRRDFYQVRPTSPSPTGWLPNSAAKWVQINYFFLHPVDCQAAFGFPGHQGDSEHVVFSLYSTDLKRWTLSSAHYYGHNTFHAFSGLYLYELAASLGTVSPSVASDEDSHASWPGETPSSSNCAGDEDDVGGIGALGPRDCFVGTMRHAFQNGYWEYPVITRNIGGPSPERWRSGVVTTSGTHAYTSLDTGHGSIPEYWTQISGGFSRFCGWLCAVRNSSGHCFNSVHGYIGCADPLSEKVNTYNFGSSSPAAAPPKKRPAARVPPSVRLQLAAALDGIERLPVADRMRIEQAILESADPIGAIAPMLAEWPEEEQAQTLRWLQRAPNGKAMILFPELQKDVRTPGERQAIAAALVDVLMQRFEGTPYALPALPEDFSPIRKETADRVRIPVFQ